MTANSLEQPASESTDEAPDAQFTDRARKMTDSERELYRQLIRWELRKWQN
jgi:hypothetical protein